MGEKASRESFQPILTNYNTQLGWLNSLITDPTGLRYLRPKPKEERLRDFEASRDRITAFLAFLGDPQNKYPSVHIAGTGGKGSVTVIIGKILQRAGFKTGVHTSPYLQAPIEKWAIDGKMVSPSIFASSIETLQPFYDSFVTSHPDKRPNYGETQAALTHRLFADRSVDFAVIETGMGGRYDPTNVLNPEIAVITNVDYDHVDQIGPTLTDIAAHKAGIIKPGKPVVTAAIQDEVLDVIGKEAQEKKAPLFTLGKDFSFQIKSYDQNGIVVEIKTPFGTYRNIRIPLVGLFQAQNAALAVAACDALAQQKGFRLDEKMINDSLANLQFPGRMEKIQTNPTVILDGAHNPQKMRALAETMEKLYPDKSYYLIVGMLATKDAKQSLAHLLPQAKKVIATKPHLIGKPSTSSQQIAQIVKEGKPEIEVDQYDTALEAVQQVIEEAASDDIILITGSLYMLGEARIYWYPTDQILFEAEYSS